MPEFTLNASGQTFVVIQDDDGKFIMPDIIRKMLKTGSALKPAWEPIFLCRAPRGDNTFAQLAVKWGTGALNIDGSRLGYASESDKAGATPQGRPTNKLGALAGSVQHGGERTEFERPEQKGRWPANFILSHTDDCVKVGEYEVEGRTINRFDQGMMPFGNAEGEDYQSKQMPPETVERWACVPSCAVRMLDDQVGEARSHGPYSGQRRSRLQSSIYGGGEGLSFEPTGDQENNYADSGGPSRFFYTAKASRSEKNRGLEHFYWERTDEGFERISLSEYEQLDRRERAYGCIHPTVKPLELLRYLSTLVLPPKQEGKTRRILIPFSGSGSEMIGATQAGWDEVTGIEMERNYIEMAEARINANIGMF